jgi:hypothetical protein
VLYSPARMQAGLGVRNEGGESGRGPMVGAFFLHKKESPTSNASGYVFANFILQRLC